MSHVILFDGEVRSALLPLTYSRPVGDLRIGILTIAEKWARQLRMPVSFLTQDYLTTGYPIEIGDTNLLIDGSVLPTPELVALILNLGTGRGYIRNGELLAACLDKASVRALLEGDDFGNVEAFELERQPLLEVRSPADIFLNNSVAIAEDYALVTAGRASQPLPGSNTLIGPSERLFVEPGARIEACILNTKDGPIYLGRDATVLEGSLLRGPLCIGEGSLVKMGAQLYKGTTLGPYCRAGGEVNNVVFQANSSKGHGGYLGNSVVGEWCNFGAGTNASNLKNDYGEVRVWSYNEERFVGSGQQFHGLVMGDHSKTAIGTTLNTGTVVGFSCNVFGVGFPRPFIPSFTWGGAAGARVYPKNKAMATAEKVMNRRGKVMGEAEREMFSTIFTESQRFRKG